MRAWSCTGAWRPSPRPRRRRGPEAPEATWQDRDDLLPFHLSSRQAADHAREAGVGKLVLTHIWPSLDHEISKDQAAEEYAGPIESAVEGMRFEVGS